MVYLLKHGADVHQALELNIGNSSIRLTSLHLATLAKGGKLVRILLRYKANAREEIQCMGDKWYIAGTSLHLSTLFNASRIADLLLKNGAQAHDKFQVSLPKVHAEPKAIHFAIARGSKTMVETLLGKGWDDDAGLKLSLQNLGTQLSALHLALLLNRESLVELLLAKGVDLCASYTVGVSKKFQAELSALHLATLSGKEGIPGLFENDVDIHAKSLASIEMIIQFELKILDVISVCRTREVTEPLLKKAIQDQAEQQEGMERNLALYLATALGYTTVLKLLLERTDNIDGKLSVKTQATVDAAFEGKFQN
ncbi:hypothetical protein DM02DRAFT_654677 [Periconia macrospinosa]|uniref:Uncharacterized protein n=1 Tax=Periconia macrospinosa TaxID=97972 RepID=A0A2V1DVI7_9PLEO|nr:hypothetical protein DM02DRAFT_654677 [Periconia macrospinosa]